jgi:hypothetical protein
MRKPRIPVNLGNLGKRGKIGSLGKMGKVGRLEKLGGVYHPISPDGACGNSQRE